MRGRPLLEALAVEPGHVLSLAGGGGKTSLMYALARALLADHRRVLTTTTTRIDPPSAAESLALLVLEEHPDGEQAIGPFLAEHGHLTVVQRRNPDGKLAGIPCSLVDALAAARVADVIIVEADGSAGRPLKAAREGEPVWAPSSTHSVLVVGVDALGAPLDEAHVFRSALAAEITGLPLGAPVTDEAAMRLLVGPQGLARGAPATSRLLVFINKVESPAQEETALALARALLRAEGRPPSRIVLGSVGRAASGFTLVGDPCQPS